jgi:hypothetical protein
METPSTYQCQRCLKLVARVHRVLHDETCFPNSQMDMRFDSEHSNSKNSLSMRMELEHSLTPIKQIYSNSNSNSQSKFEGSQRGRIIRESRSGRREEEIRTICPKCSEYIDITQIGTHMQNCQYELCRYCGQYFPLEFTREHGFLCYARFDSSEQDSIFDEEMSYSQTDSLTGQYPDMRSMSSGYSTPSRSHHSMSNSGHNTPGSTPQRPPEISLLLYQQLAPLLQFHNIQPQHVITARVTLNDQHFQIAFMTALRAPNNASSQFQNTPHIIGSHSNSSMSNQQPPILMNNALQEEDRFEEVERFIRNFLTHGNFMRLNRFALDNEFFENLLEQFFNPNEGVAREDLVHLQEVVFRRNSQVTPGEEEKCAVCFNEFENDERLRRLPCEHIYHLNCVDTWLVQNSHCPVCKLDVNQALFGERPRPRGFP